MVRTPRCRRSRWAGAAIAASITIVSACLPHDYAVLHPPALTGRWVQLRADGSWGDTFEYLADGRVRIAAAPVIDTALDWSVLRYRKSDALCRRDHATSSCQPFRLEGDTLVVGDVGRPTYYRRAR